MKKNYLLAISLIFSALGVNAQVEQNTLPNTGKVGIGTITPQSKLHVKGSQIIDSTLTVRDSVVLEKFVRIDGNSKFKKSMVVEDSVVMKKDVRINQKLVVDQKVVMRQDAFVRRDLRVEGKSRFDSLVVMNDKIRMTSLSLAPNFNNRDILLVNQNGLVQKVKIDSLGKEIFKNGEDQLKQLLYQAQIKPCKDGNDGFTTPAHPIWSNSPGKLFTDINCVPNVKVGIGLTNPTAKLHIKMANEAPDAQTTHALVIEKPGNNAQKIFQITKDGLVLAREFKVDMVAWPDYVFENDYVLMPLSEVEDFIQQNGHLPNVPKAEQIEQEGVELGEMNKILMEKVEELTLYLLQQQKQLDQQMKLLEEQAKKIEVLSNTK